MLPVRVRERVVYAETLAHSKTAVDIDPPSPTEQESAALWQIMKKQYR